MLARSRQRRLSNTSHYTKTALRKQGYPICFEHHAACISLPPSHPLATLQTSIELACLVLLLSYIDQHLSRPTSPTATYSDRKWSENGRQLGLDKNPSLVNPGGLSIATATTSTAPNHRLPRLEQQMSAGKHRAEGLLVRTPGPAPSQNSSCHPYMKGMSEAHGWERRSRA